jgi:monoterpene epsilon-lactone hydrolase
MGITKKSATRLPRDLKQPGKMQPMIKMKTRLMLLMITAMMSQNAPAQKANAIDPALHKKLVNGRAFFDGLGKNYPAAESVQVKPEMIGNVSCYWFNPAQPVANKRIIYLHGGAFAWGSIRSHKALVSHVAEQTGTTILFIEYALAPEHPYPKGVSDLISVYKHIVKDLSKTTSLFLFGDSAGGGLIVSAMQRIQGENIRQPEGIVLISPWLNLHADSPSYTENASLDPVLKQKAMKEFALAYNPNALPEANPSSIAFKQFPPVLIFVGTNEILLDDSKRFYDGIRKIQPRATLHIYPGQIHVWPIGSVEHPDARKALTQIKEFLINTGSEK